MRYQRHARMLPWRLRWRYIVSMYLLAWENGRLTPSDADHAQFIEECKSKLREIG